MDFPAISKPSKRYVLDAVSRLAQQTPALSILDLGAGESLNFAELLSRFPEVRYTGLEPDQNQHLKAKQNFRHKANVRLFHGFAGDGTIRAEEKFDLVISLSVLEHVKY